MNNGNKPAMPINTFEKDGAVSISTNEHTGLTKREMFAMYAMQAMLTSKFVEDFNDYNLPDKNATLCARAVHYADSLLKELDNDDT